MGKINKNDYGKRRPKLLVDDLNGADATALTMASVETVTSDDEEGKRQSLAITFEETGEKTYWPNATSIGIMVDAYGDDDDDWIGKPLPVMRHQGIFRGQRYDNLQVPALLLWTDIIKQVGLTPSHKDGTVTPAPKAVQPVAKRRRGR